MGLLKEFPRYTAAAVPTAAAVVPTVAAATAAVPTAAATAVQTAAASCIKVSCWRTFAARLAKASKWA